MLRCLTVLNGCLIVAVFGLSPFVRVFIGSHYMQLGRHTMLELNGTRFSVAAVDQTFKLHDLYLTLSCTFCGAYSRMMNSAIQNNYGYLEEVFRWNPVMHLSRFNPRPDRYYR